VLYTQNSALDLELTEGMASTIEEFAKNEFLAI
jgi:hypothetical protein